MISDTCKRKAMGLDLITRTGQSLHAEWCRQIREKGMHGPDKRCSRLVRLCPDPGLCVTWHCGDSLDPANYNLDEARCDQFNPDLVYWLNLPESRRQEYLATAKAVLPEIVGEVLNESKIASALYCGVPKNVRHAIEAEGYVQTHWEAAFAKIIVDALRARCLEELK